MRRLVVCLAAWMLLPAGIQADETAEPPGTPRETRDPWLWPFRATSIWNVPIGSKAVYTSAMLEPAAHVGVDIQLLLRTSVKDPVQDVLESPSWETRVGTKPLGLRLHLPDDWTVPELVSGMKEGCTPNACYAILLPDGLSVLQGCRICRPRAGGPVFLPGYIALPKNHEPIKLRGDGLSKIGQGASGMSTLGGTIRLGELVDDAPIRHAIKINPFAGRFCHYSQTVPGYRWPAVKADDYAPREYKGTNPSVVMGSLLALPPDASPEGLGLNTTPGRKLFHALQDYGVYFAEDAHWDTWDIVVERGADEEFERAHGFSMTSPEWRDEVNRLMVALQVVDNNGPKSIGGGGEPRRPLAPPFQPSVESSRQR